MTPHQNICKIYELKCKCYILQIIVQNLKDYIVQILQIKV